MKVGDTLAEMADLRHVRVRAFVDEPDLGWLEPNQDVEVTWDAKPGQTWTGRTEEMPKEVVSRGMRSVGEVLCSVDNDKLELLPNINVEVRILVERAPRSRGRAAGSGRRGWRAALRFCCGRRHDSAARHHGRNCQRIEL